MDPKNTAGMSPSINNMIDAIGLKIPINAEVNTIKNHANKPNELSTPVLIE